MDDVVVGEDVCGAVLGIGAEYEAGARCEAELV